MGFFSKIFRSRPQPGVELLEDLERIQESVHRLETPDLDEEHPEMIQEGSDFERVISEVRDRNLERHLQLRKLRKDSGLGSDVVAAENELSLLRNLAAEGMVDAETAELLEERLDGSIPLFRHLANRGATVRIMSAESKVSGIARSSDDDANERCSRGPKI